MPSEQIREHPRNRFQIRVRSCRYETVPVAMSGMGTMLVDAIRGRPTGPVCHGLMTCASGFVK